MKFAISERRGDRVKTIHFIFSEREARVLLEAVGDLKPDRVHAGIDEEGVTKEDVAKFLHSLFQALTECL